MDGWAQSLPYHIFPFLFPLQKVAYLGLFVFVTVWTVLIREFSFGFLPGFHSMADSGSGSNEQ